MKICVVGNGPSVPESPKGELVDAHDLVVRCINAKVDGYEAEVGGRTDAWATCEWKVARRDIACFAHVLLVNNKPLFACKGEDPKHRRTVPAESGFGKGASIPRGRTPHSPLRTPHPELRTQENSPLPGNRPAATAQEPGMMNENSSEPQCPKCGAPIPEAAPAGLCPKCVLGAAATDSNATATAATGGRRVPPPPIEVIAPHFPELEIVGMIGAGGMGAVYKARQPKLDRFVALKILAGDLATDPAFVERFNREARVLAKLSHPNIVTVFDFGTAGPFCFLLMEFVDGVNLRGAMRDGGGFTPAESLALVGDICGALSFAHDEGILHRDIKPENILIDARGRVKIADFGIAKLIGEGGEHDVTLTLQGSVLGSPQYMAPEQIETPGDVDQRADIYSLGVVFYELLTGELPLGRFAPPSKKSPLDPRIDEIVLRTLEKERELRYQSAGEFATGVETVGSTLAPAAPAPAPKLAPAAAEGRPAKFATASAVLTGLGLLSAVASFLYLGMRGAAISMAVPADQRLPPDVLADIMAMLALIVGAQLLLGMLFGGIALGDLRRSQGRRPGLGRALFGSLAAPVIVLGAGALTAVPLLVKAPIGSGNTLLLAGAAALGLVAAPWALWRLVRKVAAWAQGDAAPGGEVSGGKVALSASAAVAIVLVNTLLYLVWPEGGRDHGDPAFDHGPRGDEEVFSTSRAHSSGAGDTRGNGPDQHLWDRHWGGSPPTFTTFVSVPRGHSANFALRIDGGDDGPDSTVPLWTVEAPDHADYSGVLAFGVRDRPGQRTEVLAGTSWDREGGDLRTHEVSLGRGSDIALEVRAALPELDAAVDTSAFLGTLATGPELGSQRLAGRRSDLYLQIECLQRPLTLERTNR